MAQIKTISELIDQLEAIQEQFGEDCEIAAAVQPSYPLAHAILNVGVTISEDDACPIIWIASSEFQHDSMPYAPDRAWKDWNDDEDCIDFLQLKAEHKIRDGR